MKRGEVNLSITTQLQKLVKRQAEMIKSLSAICDECLSAQTGIDKQEMVFVSSKIYFVTDDACLSIAKNISFNQEHKVYLYQSGILGLFRFGILAASGPVIATIMINGQDYEEIENVKKANQEIAIDIKQFFTKQLADIESEGSIAYNAYCSTLGVPEEDQKLDWLNSDDDDDETKVRKLAWVNVARANQGLCLLNNWIEFEF